MVHPSQSVFGGMGSKKKKKKKNKKRRHSHPSQSPHPSEHEESVVTITENVSEETRDNGEIRFVLPRAKSKVSGKLKPFLFEKQLEKSSAEAQQNGVVDTRLDRSNEDEKRVDDSIDDILFGEKKTLKQNEVDLSPRKINARSVQDAVQDKIGRRPRANSTDGELNLPRHGLCDEHVILESHKWDILRLHNNNSLALHNPPPPRGMVNLGNTCFLNATLQCLLYMPSFCHSITSLPATCYETNNGGKHARGQKITMILRNLSRMAHGIIALENNEQPRSGAIAPKTIVNAITSAKTGGHRFRPGRQEDAHELLVHLLDAMHEGELFAAGINPHSSGWRDRLPIPRLDETTFVHRIFGGYFRSQLRCKCGYKSNTYDPFLDLALEVSKKHITSIETAFREFTRKETLDSDNRWKCDGCKKHVCPTKHLSVFRPPLSLCIHLKRFDFGAAGFGRGGWGEGYGHRHGKGLSMMGGGGSKINKSIEFPSQLNLPLSDNRVCEYKLTGIIVHVGNSATSGHYTAFVKKPGDFKTWYHMDDSFVEVVSEKTVLKQRDAYVLFYSRKEVQLEFPQPPREPALKNGVKHNVLKAKSENKTPNGTSIKAPKESKHVDKPSSMPSATPDPKKDSKSKTIILENGSSNKLSAARSLQFGESSPISPKSTSTVSPRSDSSAIKHAHEADRKSSSSDTSDSDSSESQKDHLVNIKKSLEYSDKVQIPSSAAKTKKPKPATVMKGNNVEVVLKRHKKRAWKPQEAAKVNSDKGNVLLGNIAVSDWNDDEPEISKKSKKAAKDDVLREIASKEMESADRSRKRGMHLDKWDAAIDEGRKKKIKIKNPDLESMMRSTSNSFQRMQRDFQRMSKGKAKGFRPKEQPSGRISSFNKMKKNSMQKSRKSI
ncbi:hypothetical protein ACHAXN_008748 [Cyclotella atomus]